MKARFFALAFLGWRFALHLLRKLWPFYRSPGLEQYRENYEAEGLTIISPEERRSLTRFEKCIACDACLVSYFSSRNQYSPRTPTPRDLALCLSRSMPDYPSAREIVDEWKAPDGFKAVCPRGVDLSGIVELMKRHIASYDRSTHSNKPAGN